MMRMIQSAVALLAICGVTAPAYAQHPIMEINVAGNDRLPASAVIAASGLHKGQTVTRAGLDAAAQRLADTGFFASVSYGYDPKTAGGVTGYALTFHVSSRRPAHLWSWISQAWTPKGYGRN